jgi:putative ABC transport system permease protein
MRASDYLRALRSVIAQNRFRTLLTLLGITIGSGTIVLLAGVLHSASDALVDLAQAVSDADVVSVRRDEPALADAQRARRELSQRDVDELRQSAAVGALDSFGESSFIAQGAMRGHTKDLTLVGGGPQLRELHRLSVRQGRFLREEDLAAHARICVVGAEIWSELAEDGPLAAAEPVLRVEGVSLRIVGVLEHKPSMIDDGRALFVWDRKVIIPQSTFDIVYGRHHAVDRAFVRLPRGTSATHRLRAAEARIAALLTRLHLGVTNFSVGAKGGFLQQQALITGIIRLLMLCSGILALFSGGLNISNTMLIAVAERTREIGIRRALGATPRDILLQFLSESALLALLGGIFGVACGCALIALVGVGVARIFPSWVVCIEPWSVALGLVLAVVTGIVFGVMPARRAAALDPIEALRAE